MMATSPLRKDLHEENRLSWNEATKAHNSHKGDQAKFFREGGSTLFSEDSDLAPLRTNPGNVKRYAIRLPDFCELLSLN